MLTNENDPMSYYQIAGIHGRPYKAWNNVVGKAGLNAGYCTHSSILFMTWHRPYLALYEQALCSHVTNVANQFTGSLKSQFVQAAQTFRMPYWDWASPPTGPNNLPNILTQSTVQVTGTNGQVQTITNPLASYRFNPINPSAGDFPGTPWSSWQNTLRWPTSQTSSAQSDTASLQAAFNQQLSYLKNYTRYIMTAIPDFQTFSNDMWMQNGNPGQYGGLEDIHDNVHGYVGNGGHMGVIPYAAFDPIFWLHHTNIDRLFAMWHALNPSTSNWVTPHGSTGTLTNPPGSIEDINTALTPFWKTTTTFWTSNDVRESTVLGYAYTETQSWNYSTSSSYWSSINAAIANLYGSTVSASSFTRLAAAVAPAAAQKVLVARAAITPEAAPVTQKVPAAAAGVKMAVAHAVGVKPVAAHAAPGNNPGSDKEQIAAGEPAPKPASNPAGPGDTFGSYTEWIANIKVEKHCLAGTFMIHIFLGDFDPDSKNWMAQPNNVGTSTILGSDADDTGCGKCKDDASRRLKVTSMVPLTEALVDAIEAGRLGSLDEDDVVPYLKQNLHWRVTLGGGVEKSRAEVPSLKVSVVSTEVSLPGPDAPPRYSGDYKLHPAVTRGRPAGFNDDDEV